MCLANEFVNFKVTKYKVSSSEKMDSGKNCFFTVSRATTEILAESNKLQALIWVYSWVKQSDEIVVTLVYCAGVCLQ